MKNKRRLICVLVEQFKKAAKENNRTASQLLRDCMIDYVKEHRQSTLKE